MAAAPGKTVIIVAGPTAAGKTAVAIALAKQFATEIISVDSRQCFRELNIGVARPSPEELSAVPHHFIASHSIQEEVTAALFEQFALQKAAELFQHHDTVVMVGGTGLYIKAFCEGLDAIPTIDPAIREEIIQQYESKGLDWLQNEVKTKDPDFYATGEILNPQRMMRALEVMESTGQSVLSFRKRTSVARDFKILKIGLDIPREELHQRINARVDRMIEMGLLDEVRTLIPYRHLNALQTVGYTELFDHLDGKCSLTESIEKIKAHTRQYARRQLTWFRKDGYIQWFTPGQQKEMIDYLNDDPGE
jgi:tRNA dimethylallyltransferase